MDFSKLLCYIFIFLSSQTLIQAMYDKVTRGNFDNFADGTRLLILLFYKDACDECQKVNPIFQQAVEKYNDREDVVLSAVHVLNDRVLAMRFNVEKVPVVKYFPYSRREYTLQGEITLEQIDEIITSSRFLGKLTHDLHANEDKLSYVYSRDKKLARAKEITSDEFSQIVLDPKKHVLLSLYTDGCAKECDEFDKVAEVFKDEDHVAVVKLNVVDAPEVANHFSSTRNPTLIWFPKDDKSAGKIYGSGINVHELVGFLNDHTGSNREASGQLSINAGRIPELDMILKEHVFDVIIGRNLDYLIDVIKKKRESVKQESRYFDYYVKLLEEMKKGKSADVVLEKENDYITKRLSKRDLSVKEREEWTKFRNIIHGLVDMAAEKLQATRRKETAETIVQKHEATFTVPINGKSRKVTRDEL